MSVTSQQIVVILNEIQHSLTSLQQMAMNMHGYALSDIGRSQLYLSQIKKEIKRLDTYIKEKENEFEFQDEKKAAKSDA